MTSIDLRSVEPVDQMILDNLRNVVQQAALLNNCLRRKVFCVIDDGQFIVAYGSNGTPWNWPKCSEGGCPRCGSRNSTVPSTERLADNPETCLCIHAEERAAIAAGEVENGRLSINWKPCLGCLKILGEIGIVEVYYLYDWHYADTKLEMLMADVVRRFRRFEQVWLPEGSLA